ncbi:MAG TPA: SDR family NAD(P)-dependent oxidoreductase, partial [Exilispira sp.]|nr:SDR family NAD(P)-dependent oxidoreductase [Exilispira sp.]
RNIEKLKKEAAKWEKDFGIRVDVYSLDVRDYQAIDKLFSQLPDFWNDVDILINNAGLALGLEKIWEGDRTDWDTMIDTNIKGLLYMSRFVVQKMRARNMGHIINIGSIAGTQVYENGVVYCATKAAVKFISDGLRIELVDTPIKVTNIQPGLVETNFSIVRFHNDIKRAEKVYQGIEALSGNDIAEIIYFVADTKPHVQIAEVTVMPTNQASPISIYKK